MKKKFLIRFNTQATGEHDLWRIIDGDVEHLVSEIHLNVPSKTSKDEMEDVGVKYHVACEGELKIVQQIATID